MIDDCTAELRSLLRFTDALREVDKQLPRQSLHVLLATAIKPGITQAELAAETKLAASSVSRNIAALGTTHRDGEAGLGFLAQAPHPTDGRASAIYLTTKGRDLVRRLLRATTGKAADGFNPRVVR